MASSSRAAEPPVRDVPADSRSVSDESDSSNEEGWEDVEPDDETQPVIGLFSVQVFPDVRSMLQDCKEKHSFDLLSIQKKLGMSAQKISGPVGIETDTRSTMKRPGFSRYDQIGQLRADRGQGWK